jgi:cytochrome c-type biogenesis protein CcmH/NrfF
MSPSITTPNALPPMWRGRKARAVSWALVAVVVVSVLALGTFSGRGAQSAGERAHALAEEIACPQCAGESVAQSQAPAAVNIYGEIVRQIDAGQTDDQIRSYLANQFGEDILLRPSATGPSALIWVIPVVAVVIAAAALGATFRRWNRTAELTATDEDRVLVESYLATRHGEGDGR